MEMNKPIDTAYAKAEKFCEGMDKEKDGMTIIAIKAAFMAGYCEGQIEMLRSFK